MKQKGSNTTRHDATASSTASPALILTDKSDVTTKERVEKKKEVSKCESQNNGKKAESQKAKQKDVGKIVLLPCDNCKNRTVVYSCSCNKVVYCGTVCQTKHWEAVHQYSEYHEDETDEEEE